MYLVYATTTAFLCCEKRFQPTAQFYQIRAKPEGGSKIERQRRWRTAFGSVLHLEEERGKELPRLEEWTRTSALCTDVVHHHRHVLIRGMSGRGFPSRSERGEVSGLKRKEEAGFYCACIPYLPLRLGKISVTSHAVYQKHGLRSKMINPSDNTASPPRISVQLT